MLMQRVDLRRAVIFLLMGIIHPAMILADNGAELRWDELNQRDPYIYTVPRIDKATVIDGIYVKKALREGTIVPCRRCPDWLANPGIWRLSFNKGGLSNYKHPHEMEKHRHLYCQQKPNPACQRSGLYRCYWGFVI